MFSTVLVANRGEIACRIIDTLRRLGVTSIAVHSDPDAGARHVGLADVAVAIGGAAAADSYLDVGKIVRAAVRSGAQAVHPGYGFLAESVELAAACRDAGVVFIGPGVEALAVMGDKISAKASVAARGVPTVPGVARAGMTDAEIADAIAGIGFPALIKPSAGGGGKGMHRVDSLADIGPAVAAARREAASAFGDDTLFVERFLARPRHIEVQVLADAGGRTIALGERECSLQRRHQKVIEEAPSVLLDTATRNRIGQAACETALSVGYLGAGTVEFIVSADAPDEFFFLEMNTRLQVEHPVTEMVTGLDLVEWQLRIAAGEHIDFSPEEVAPRGHAIEARVYAEDPAAGFLPTGGTVTGLVEPSGEGIRVDSSLQAGLTVTSRYDPMLAKIIAWAPTRPQALQRLSTAIRGTAVLGVQTNLEFLGYLLEDPDVVAGRLDTELIGRRLEQIRFRRPDDLLYIAAALLCHRLALDARPVGPWASVPGWRLGAHRPTSYRLSVLPGDERTVVSVAGPPHRAVVTVAEGEEIPAALTVAGSSARVEVAGVSRTVYFAHRDDVLHLQDRGAQFSCIQTASGRRSVTAASAQPELRSPMPGLVVALLVADGQAVAEGDGVLVVEAMKMEHVVRAPRAGTVAIAVAVGAQVQAGEVLASVAEPGSVSVPS